MEQSQLLESEIIEKYIGNIREHLLGRKETIAVAESVTSGLIQAVMATAPDASQFYQGGITAYNLGQKYRHLGVEPIHAQGCDCVSEKVAAEMALNVCNLFCSNWGIGITGYAAPVPESNNKLFAYYAVCYKGELIIQKHIKPTEKKPFQVQAFYIESLLKDIDQYIEKAKTNE
jgi:nicotinamide-nucleotide amidase